MDLTPGIPGLATVFEVSRGGGGSRDGLCGGMVRGQDGGYRKHTGHAIDGLLAGLANRFLGRAFLGRDLDGEGDVPVP